MSDALDMAASRWPAPGPWPGESGSIERVGLGRPAGLRGGLGSSRAVYGPWSARWPSLNNTQEFCNDASY